MQILPDDVLLTIAGFAQHNSLALIFRHVSKLFSNHIKPKPREKSQMVFSVSSLGSLNQIKWMMSVGYEYGEFVIQGAARGGNIDIIEYALEQGSILTEEVAAYCAEGGSLKTLRWLRERGCPWSGWVCLSAAYNGRLDLLLWAMDNGCPLSDLSDERRGRDICGEAAYGGWLHILEAVMDNPKYGVEVEFRRNVIEGAIRQGHIAILDWICERKTVNLLVNDYYYAAYNNQLSSMKWLHSKGLPMTQPVADMIFISIPHNGTTLSIVEWMINTFPNIELNGSVLNKLFSDAREDLIRCLVSGGYVCDETLCMRVTEEGNYDLLKWLVKEGCSTDGSICAKIIERGDFDTLREMVGLGCVIDEQSFSNAAERGDVEILSYLLAFDVDMEYGNVVLETAVMCGNMISLRWALDVGYKITDSVIEYAQLGGHEKVINLCMSLS